MVKSQTTSITPAQHAARHVIGGADPLVDPITTTAHGASHKHGSTDLIPGAKYTADSSANALTQVTGPTDGNTAAAWNPIAGMGLTLAGVVPDTLRISFEGKHSGSSLCKMRLYRSGVAVGTPHEGTGDLTTSFVEYIEDISGWSVGDVIQVYGYGSGGAHKATAQNFKILGVVGLSANTLLGSEIFSVS